MTTVSELVDQGDIPEERKDHVKKVLRDLVYAPKRAVGKAFLKISEKHMRDAGMSAADANAILAEVEPLQGTLLLLNHQFNSAQRVSHSLAVDLFIVLSMLVCHSSTVSLVINFVHSIANSRSELLACL